MGVEVASACTPFLHTGVECIECNWVNMTGPFAPFAQILATLGAVLGLLGSLLYNLFQWVNETFDFEGTSAGGAAYNTADDISEGTVRGGMGTANDPPTPPSTTRVPPPPPSPGQGLESWFGDRIGYDIVNLGRQ